MNQREKERIQAHLKWISLYEETKDAGLVCRRCGISRPTLRKWLKRFANRVLSKRRPFGVFVVSFVLESSCTSSTLRFCAQNFLKNHRKYSLRKNSNEGISGLKELIEMMYDEELKNHLGFSKHDARPEDSDNYRNGSYGKSVKTSTGKLDLSVPRDRNGEFEPQIVKKHQTDIFGIEDKIISLIVKQKITYVDLPTGKYEFYLIREQENFVMLCKSEY